MDSADVRFRKEHGAEWARFLLSPMGQAFMSAVYSQRPMAMPDLLPHKDSYTLGKIFQHDLVLNFLAVSLCMPVSDPTSVPQNYPEEDNPENPTKKE